MNSFMYLYGSFPAQYKKTTTASLPPQRIQITDFTEKFLNSIHFVKKTETIKFFVINVNNKKLANIKIDFY